LSLLEAMIAPISFLGGLAGLLDLLKFLHSGAFQIAVAGFRIEWLGGEALLDRKSIGKNPLKHRIFRQFRIHRRSCFVTHGGKGNSSSPPQSLSFSPYVA
jgi:hypothetical protein